MTIREEEEKVAIRMVAIHAAATVWAPLSGQRGCSAPEVLKVAQKFERYILTGENE